MVSINLEREAKQITYDASLAPDDALVRLRCTAGDDQSITPLHLNNGFGVITYPNGFSGSTLIEVLDEFDNIVDSGFITV